MSDISFIQIPCSKCTTTRPYLLVSKREESKLICDKCYEKEEKEDGKNKII